MSHFESYTSAVGRQHEEVAGVQVRSEAPVANVHSDGKLTSVAMAEGGGPILFDGLCVNRWHPHAHRQQQGYVIYIRDLESGSFWPANLAPSAADVDASYGVRFSSGCTRYERRQHEIRTSVDVWVSAETEFRRLTIHNESGRSRRLDVTSYLEIVLDHRAADRGHPAFSKLFVQTSYDSATNSIRAWRRQRSPDDQPILFVHGMQGEGRPGGFETARPAFIGRGRDTTDPCGMQLEQLEGRIGSVLDPIASLRRSLTLQAGAIAEVVMYTAAARSPERVAENAERLADAALDFDAEQRHARRREERRHEAYGLDPDTAGRRRRMTAALFYRLPRRCATGTISIADTAPLAHLETYGLDTVTPLLLARVAGDDLVHFGELLRMQAYWESVGLRTQLVAVCNERNQASVEALVHGQLDGIASGSPPFRRVLRVDLLPEPDLVLLQNHSTICVPAGEVAGPDGGPQLADAPHWRRASGNPGRTRVAPDELLFYNGYGGFHPDGSEYVIDVRPDENGGHMLPPHPWANVIANEQIGFVVTERGSTSTWATNSRENRLTPWYNDPISDPSGEALYFRDEEGGEYWSATPGPCPSPAAYTVRHGLGYTAFESEWAQLGHVTTQFVDPDRPLKVTRIELENRSDRERTVSVFAYHHLVLGPDEDLTAPHVSLEWDGKRECVIARNRSNNEFRDQVVFLAARADSGESYYSFDRSSFIGEGSSLACPRALEHVRELRAVQEPGAKPGVILQIRLKIPAGGRVSADFLMGAADSTGQIDSLVDLKDGGTTAILQRARNFWVDLTGRLRIETPAPELDLMVNAWLPYQNLSCRILGRTAFYQSGGAFGYRDQLQDASAMVYLDPALTRRQIVLHAEHQFEEGDVLHWWHPPTSKGIRTLFSDDLLWLPYIASFYVRTTGDASVLDEPARFLKARQLNAGEDEAFVYPQDTGETASVFEHCCRALDRSLAHGRNGLPLMGTGDWNDGMNRVGRRGQGESVWLGFFIYHILNRFIPICEARGDGSRADTYREHREHLLSALNDAGWDGEWYRRAFYDNGNVIGSKQSDECKIDALAQAWAVISGAATEQRVEMALDALERYLVDEEAGIIRLLTPAFDQTPDDPGYIKGYVPGVRENGGQYTHGVLWAVRALAEAGRGGRAARLLSMLSPISHALTKDDADRYHVEPFVIAADVYGEPPHVGRGGWTWYTGSAGWMYRVTLESVLGIRIEGGSHLLVDPRIPSDWDGFTVTYRVPGIETTYVLRITNKAGRTQGVRAAWCNEGEVEIVDGAARIPLRDNDERYNVTIEM